MRIDAILISFQLSGFMCYWKVFDNTSLALGPVATSFSHVHDSPSNRETYLRIECIEGGLG